MKENVLLENFLQKNKWFSYLYLEFRKYAKNIIQKSFIYNLNKYYEKWGWGYGGEDEDEARWRVLVQLVIPTYFPKENIFPNVWPILHSNHTHL